MSRFESAVHKPKNSILPTNEIEKNLNQHWQEKENKENIYFRLDHYNKMQKEILAQIQQMKSIQEEMYALKVENENLKKKGTINISA